MLDGLRISIARNNTPSAARNFDSFQEFLPSIHALELSKSYNSSLLMSLRIFLHFLKLVNSFLVELINLSLELVPLAWIFLNLILEEFLLMQHLSHFQHILQAPILVKSEINVHYVVLIHINQIRLRVF